MKDNPKISVIIPVYNPGKYLYACLDSIVNQTYRNLQIILVDDGSSDGSGKVCDAYAEKDSRITVVHKQNEGVSKARNTGIDLVTGDYYYFPDSDDYIESDSFEYLLGLMGEHNCDAVVFEHYSTYPSYEEAHRLPKDYYGLYEGKEEIVKISFRIAFAWNKLFSKKLIPAQGPLPGIEFREDIYRGEDGIFSREALHRAERVWFTDRTLYHYVQSEESACRGVFRPSQLSYLKTMKISEKWFAEHFPQYLPGLKNSRLESYIMLYYDMWADEKDYRKECKDLVERFKKEYPQRDKSLLSRKQKIKLALFRMSPAVFCRLHSIHVKKIEGKARK